MALRPSQAQAPSAQVMDFLFEKWKLYGDQCRHNLSLLPPPTGEPRPLPEWAGLDGNSNTQWPVPARTPAQSGNNRKAELGHGWRAPLSPGCGMPRSQPVMPCHHHSHWAGTGTGWVPGRVGPYYWSVKGVLRREGKDVGPMGGTGPGRDANIWKGRHCEAGGAIETAQHMKAAAWDPHGENR